ncbi:MAG: rRNA maturation RNase YbeY [Candidatus Omnitrophica bacterium]|nr:rRNA maturation RNase YbeY [Candidatus Omnitrophota bacterium]
MKITIRNLQKKIPIYPTRIKKSILKALKGEGVKRGEITVSFVNDRTIAKLNSKYLKKSQPTDVLAFNLGSLDAKAKNIFADIIVSAQTARRNAKIYKTTLSYELNLYSVHGVLHILGYNDHDPKEIKIMRKKETGYVNS